MIADRIVSALALALAAAYFAAASRIPELAIGDPLGPRVFPRILSFALAAGAVMLFLETLRRERRAGAAAGPGQYAVVGAVVIWTGAYFATFEKLGYVAGSALYLFVLMAFFNRGRWRANGLTAVLFALVTYLPFTRLLGVNLPQGVLPF